MSGTTSAGKAAAATIKKKYDAYYLEHYGMTFYKYLGHLGGKNSIGGFASDTVGRDGLTGKERARQAGAKGGRLSRRGKARLWY
jgi:hypothetical protein